VSRSARDVRIFVDGHAYAVTAPRWSQSVPLVKGTHRVYAEVEGKRSEVVTYEVQ
jgi:hypothetical protein